MLPLTIQGRGRRPADLTGQRFADLTAVLPVGRDENGGGYVWRWRCACGGEIDLPAGAVRRGKHRRCDAHSDLSGRTCRTLQVIGPASDQPHPDRLLQQLWSCECADCGAASEHLRTDLTGHRARCPCEPSQRVTEDLIGRVFGALTVLLYRPDTDGACWLCGCECGRLHAYGRAALVEGLQTSCGCRIHRDRMHALTVQSKSAAHASS
jgi:hypothetical protein